MGDWKALAARLTTDAATKPHLEAVRDRLQGHADPLAVQREIAQEIASALCRSEEKVRVAFEQLTAIGKELEAGRTQDRIERFNAKRNEALRALTDFRIHREAIGLRHHDLLEKLYPIPPRASPLLPGGGGAGASS